MGWGLTLRLQLHWSQNWCSTSLWTDSRQGSKNQPHYCLWMRLHWNWSNWHVVPQPLPTVWPNKLGLFQTIILARHLLRFV